jgi:hypothetical protein
MMALRSEVTRTDSHGNVWALASGHGRRSAARKHAQRRVPSFGEDRKAASPRGNWRTKGRDPMWDSHVSDRIPIERTCRWALVTNRSVPPAGWTAQRRNAIKISGRHAMKPSITTVFVLTRATLFTCLVLVPIFERQPLPKADFATDIQPIFRASCYTCHQGDKARAPSIGF